MTDNLTDDELLTLLYYDLEKGFGSIQSLYKQAKEIRSSILLDDVKKWMTKQPNKQRKAYRGSGNSYIANYPRDQYQMDIGDMNELKKTKKQKRYLFVIIDIFSKYSVAYPLSDKSSDQAYTAIKKAFQTMGIPRSVYTDDGSEFKGKVKELFDNEGVKHIVTLSHAHNVERMIRTIKNGLHDRVRFNNAPWEDMLEYVMKKYLNTEHSSTGYKPVDAIKDQNASDIKVKLEMNAIHARRYPRISINDKVKTYKKPGKYGETKESKSRWSEQTYTVEDIKYGMVTSYKLQGLTKEYLRHELLLINE